MIRRIIRFYIFFTFARNFFFSLPFATYFLYLQSRGMNMFQLSVIKFACMLSIFLFEIPTGAFADLYGRKKSFLLSLLLISIAYVVYSISDTFLMFIFLEIFIGFSLTFFSGAFISWVIDSLKFFGFVERLDTVISKGQIAVNSGMVMGGLVGAYLAKTDMRIPWIIGGIGTLCLFVLTILSTKEYTDKIENKNVAKEKVYTKLINISKDSITYGFKNKNVMRLVGGIIVFGIFTMPLNVYWQPYFQNTFKLPIEFMGWINTSNHLSLILGTLILSYFSKKSFYSSKKSILLSLLIIGSPFCFIYFANLSFLPILFLFQLHEIGRGLFLPSHTSLFNESIPSEKRATLNSFLSMMSMLGYALGSFLFGRIAYFCGIKFSWLCVSVILMLSIIFYEGIKEK